MNRHYRLHAPLLPVAMALTAGIATASHVGIGQPLVLALLIMAFLITLCLYRFPRMQTAGIWLCTFLFGMQLALQPARPTPRLLQRAEANMLHYRTQLLEAYSQQGVGEADYAILSAMTLGDKTALTHDIREVYNTTGAGHILALSGLHLGILYMLISLLAVGGRWRMLTQAVTILAIWAFAMLTGLSPSVVRAATMLTVYGLLSLGYRSGASVNVLAFTAVVMLVVSPQSLFSIGFQMSFMAVLGILLFMPLLEGLIPADYLQRHRAVRWLWSMTVLSLTAQLAVAPLIAFYFHRFSTYFLLANFVVVPCAYVILLGALLLLVTGLPVVATVLVLTLRGMNGALEQIAALPGASIEGLYPTWLQTALIYVIIACLYVIFLTFARRQ